MKARLPLMPGTNELVHADMLRTNYRRCQTLKGMHSGAHVVSDPQLDTYLVQAKKTSTDGALPPAHLAHDRKVLRFKAYFREGVHESARETERVRLCLLYYFLEDNSAAVVEPRQQNSGLAQGTIVKRHRVVIGDGRPLDETDLALGRDVHIYGKVFRIYDCDGFTREYYASKGVDVGEPAQPPAAVGAAPPRKLAARPEKLTAGRTAAAGGSSATREEVKQTTQFLQHDRKVLRFKAFWDERTNTGPQRRFFNVYYFLADDCFEVIEVHAVNSGRDPFPSFVRRRKCPKQQSFATLTFRKPAEGEYYTDADLYTGAVISICGKNFTLSDCDAFTKEYLAEHHGRSEDELRPIDAAVPAKTRPPAPVPPHNGFGDEEDALRSCKRLTATCPVKDIRRMIEEGDQVLKFSLVMLSGNPAIDGLRRFTLTFYVADNTLMITEASERNSGLLGGRFLQRQKVKLPGGVPAEPQHFYIGATVTIAHSEFRVVSSDERTLSYMEHNAEEFKVACINTVLAKLRALATTTTLGFRSWLAESTQLVDYDLLLKAVGEFSLPLTEHEVVTAARYVSRTYPEGLSCRSLFDVLCDGDAACTEGSDDPWDVHFTAWQQRRAAEHQIASAEAEKAGLLSSTRASQGMLKVLRVWAARRQLMLQEMRTLCDLTRDGNIGAAEFEKLVQQRLKLDLTEKQLEETCARLFPASLPRASYRELIKILDQTTSYPHSSRVVASMK